MCRGVAVATGGTETGKGHDKLFFGERVAQGWATLEKQAKQKCAAPRQAKHGMRSVAGETLLEVGSADMQRQIGSKTE